MSATIFCTFDQQDLADLAMGQLRSEFHGIHHVSYSVNSPEEHPGHENSSYGFGTFFVNSNSAMSTGITPSRPATVRISCEDGIRDKVVSRLVNLHAYKIVST